ncbi:MAG: nicotinic acid mononucleotide adenyltransferase [Patiriisocius sp.]|uniref:nicotinic acid mononucleotide adenyltransferase n=1 Tax=Patiriisocius sp. TaxID=2822396 RepID=UPI003EF3E42C
MKTTKLFLMMSVLALMFTSCYTETVIVEDTIIEPQPSVTLADLLSDYELWYVDVNQSNANGEIPFMQIAFTLSFEYGTLYANNNLVGIGDQGYGLGIDVGYYNTNGFDLIISHDLDGNNRFEVTQLNYNTLELFNRATGSYYTIIGYQRDTFDYNALFYDNIHYFVQEYVTWEKTYSSQEGAINEFDNENFVAFLPGGGDGNFKSSQDQNGTNPNNIFYDYTGIYNVDDVTGNRYLKFLTLDYDFLGNEYFEMSVIDDRTISLYHPNSGTTYEFTGRGYIQYKNGEGQERGKLRLSKEQIEKQMVKISTF